MPGSFLRRFRPSSWAARNRFAPSSALLLLPLLAAGCGGSSSSNNSAALSVALADAPSDDVTSFNLTVSAISITSSTGAVKSLLATPIVVDLASLSTFSQLVDLELIDPGMYTSASITVNFTSPTSCFLKGQTTPAALVDDLGVPLTGSMTLPLDFTASPFNAVTGQHHVMELDFDLNQMLSVDLAGNSVEVVPTVQARFDRTDQNALAAFGEGVSINLTSSSGVLELESLAKVQLRQIALAFDVNTVYHVNGVPFVGSTGLSALGSNNIGTWFQAFGIPQPGFQSILVTYIEAGTGTFQGGDDLVDGYVVDGTGVPGTDPSYTVLGTSSNSAGVVTHVNTSFTVNGSFTNSHFLLRGSSSAFTGNSINVGQHIQAYGTLSLTTLDATGAAGTGILRALATKMSGTAVAPLGGTNGTTLFLDLARVGPLDQALFTWPDSGATPPNPANFAIELGTLGSSLTIVPGTTPFVVTGNLKSIDNVLPEIATATSVQDVTSKPVVLSLRDRANGFTVATATTGGLIDFTITGVQGLDETASLDSGFQGVVPLPLGPPDPTVVAGTAPSIYTIFHGATNTTASFALFGDFVTALGKALAGTETLRNFAATGSFAGGTNAFAADSATAVLQ